MQTIDISSYETKSAVLFLIFNRPATTMQVFAQIRSVKPKRLYIAADGPRTDQPGEDDLCRQSKAIVNDIDWDCEVKTLFRENNSGCKEAVSAAVSWFFGQEDEGIVLEDDCLPAKSFFMFCDVLLEKYRYDTRIRHITGCNLQFGKKWGDDSYYFSNRTHVWGWASWKRAWSDYDKDLARYSNVKIRDQMKNIYEDPLVVESWVNIFNEVKAGKINSWAYPLDFVNFLNNGLVIIPNENLISNIGFSTGATHTVSEESVYASIPLTEIEEITHPVVFLPHKQADLSIMNRDFNIAERRRKQNLLRRRFKRWFKSTLKQASSFISFS